MIHLRKLAKWLMAPLPSRSQSALPYTLLLLALAGYLLPWILASSASMTLNAHDLAEWASLHPSQPGANPPLLVPLLLRAHLVILAILTGALAATPRRAAGAALVIALLAVAQLPPPEFVRDLNNLNYRQQLSLAIASAALGFGALSLRRRKVAPLLVIAVSLLGIALALSGSAYALQLYGQLNQAGDVGIGVWVLCLSYLLTAAIGLPWRDFGSIAPDARLPTADAQ